MKYIIAFCCLFLAIILCGCDSDNKSLHNFYSDPTVAPYSHYIKKQVLKNETNSEYKSLHTYEYTKSGKLLSRYGT